jgi:hypothetical protein
MRPRYKLAEVRPDDKRSLGGPKARTLSTRHARLVAMARLPRRSQTQIRIRRALIIAGKPLSTADLARIIYRTTKLKHWHTYSTRRAAVKVARPIGRRRSRGMPILWEYCG